MSPVRVKVNMPGAGPHSEAVAISDPERCIFLPVVQGMPHGYVAPPGPHTRTPCNAWNKAGARWVPGATFIYYTYYSYFG